jgi:outer membrane lipoprotein SlyB
MVPWLPYRRRTGRRRPGQPAEAHLNNRPGLEITVRLDNGELRAITQDADEPFRIGERVRLLSNGRTTRVTH